MLRRPAESALRAEELQIPPMWVPRPGEHAGTKYRTCRWSMRLLSAPPARRRVNAQPEGLRRHRPGRHLRVAHWTPATTGPGLQWLPPRSVTPNTPPQSRPRGARIPGEHGGATFGSRRARRRCRWPPPRARWSLPLRLRPLDPPGIPCAPQVCSHRTDQARDHGRHSRTPPRLRVPVPGPQDDTDREIVAASSRPRPNARTTTWRVFTRSG
jgi:hypothetical protein